MTYHCPHCGKKVLSRRSGLCGHCLNPLPPEFLPTTTELEKVEADEQAREQRRNDRTEAKRKEYENSKTCFGGEDG